MRFIVMFFTAVCVLFLVRIDKLFARSFKSGYCSKQYYITDILKSRDLKLWRRITTTETALKELLPPERTRHLRKRAHKYILPRIIQSVLSQFLSITVSF